MCMMHQHNHEGVEHNHAGDIETKPWYMTPVGLMSLGLAAVAAFYYLWAYHQQHVLALLPFALLLLCPLMHLFGHGHGHQHGGQADLGRRVR